MFKLNQRPCVGNTIKNIKTNKSNTGKGLMTPLLAFFALTTHFNVSSNTFNEPDFSADYNYNYKEFNNIETDVKTLTSDVFGDSIDVGSGSLSFKQTDVSIPGNFQLPVEITRSLGTPDNWFNAPLQVGNWSIDLPHVRSTYVSLLDGTYNGAYWPSGNACSTALNSNPDFSKPGGTPEQAINYALYKEDYWNGDTIYIPSKGSAKLLTKSDNTRYNNQQWTVDCLEENGRDYFQITTLDGTIYTMKEQRIVTDYQKVAMSPPPEENCHNSSCDPDTMQPDSGSDEFKLLKHYIFLLVTQVEDKYGNTVTYNYAPNSNGKLTSIVASDQRTINLYYNGNDNLSSITANGRTWTYNYDSMAFGIEPLKEVILPDNVRTWQFAKTADPENNSDLTNTYWREFYPPSVMKSDDCIAVLDDKKFIQITHPDGLVGEFYLAAHCHGQSNVPKIRQHKTTGDEDFHWLKKENRVIGISQKKLTLTNGQQYIWQYDYSTNGGVWEGESGPDEEKINIPNTEVLTDNLKTTTVTQPNGDYQIHYFDRRYGSSQGNELYVESYQAKTSGDKLLKLVSKTYDQSYKTDLQEDPDGDKYDGKYGLNLSIMNMQSPDSFEIQYKSYNDEKLTRLTSQTTRIYETNSNNSSLYTQEVTEFNDWNKVVAFTSSNDFTTKSRYVEYEYVDDGNYHAYNLTGKTYVSDSAITKANDELAFETTYVSLDTIISGSSRSVLVVDEQRRFGQWRKKNVDYFGDGNLAKVEYSATLLDGTGNRYVSFANYHRGQPQSITIPARYTSATLTASRTVDNNGWVESFTDFANNETEYEYDITGRITAVAPKNGLEAGTLFSWSNNGAPVRTETRCMLTQSNDACSTSELLQTVTEYDSMLRPTKVSITDVANNYTIKQDFEHDFANQKTFESFKYTGASQTDGITTTYDGLGRTSTVTTDFGGTVTTAYLTNNRHKVTKEHDGSNSYDTTTQYLAFGTPSDKHAIEIVSQVGNGKSDVITKITMNVYEEIEQITQYDNDSVQEGEIVEHRIYDLNHNLCKINRPDVGMTAFEYSEGGELLWQAQDFTSTNNTSCEASVSDNIKVNFTYDNLGDKYQVTYHADSSTPNLVHEYDNLGNLTKLTAGNVVQDYDYDVRGLLETETLNVEGEIFTLGYTYNNLNHLASITYPDTDIGKVEFAPNAFGLATKAQSTTQIYASGATYYPNNAMEKFKYGNDLYHFVGLNDRQLPETLAYCTSSNGEQCDSSIVNYTYGYDYQNNITSITDNVNTAYSINSLNYDGLERLISTSGGTSMGSSQLDYDALGNIESFSSLNSDLDHVYDASKQLTSVGDSTGNNIYLDIDYDNRGNITKRVKRKVVNGQNQDTTDDFTYNLANQMIRANETDYLYDGHNRRVAVTKNGRRTYSFYNQKGQLVYRKTPAGGISYIFMDKKLVAKDGNVSESGATGKMHYKPFGDTLTAAKDDVGYTGHKFDADLQLSYMQARYYDPVIGRFYGNDPVGYTSKNPVMSFNRYMYVNNNPYKYKDPNGEFLFLAAPLVIGAVIGAVETAMIDTYTKGETSFASVATGALTGAVTGLAGGVGKGIDTLRKVSKLKNADFGNKKKMLKADKLNQETGNPTTPKSYDELQQDAVSSSTLGTTALNTSLTTGAKTAVMGSLGVDLSSETYSGRKRVEEEQP